MTTPISLFIAVDVTAKTCAHNPQIIRIAEAVLDSLQINDDVGCVLVSTKMVSIVPFKTLRTHAQKQEILHELSVGNDGGHSLDGGDPSRVMQYTVDAIAHRPVGNSWRPVYVLFITDGRPCRERRDEILSDLIDKGVALHEVACKIKDNAGAVTLMDVFVTNDHHYHKPFGAIVTNPCFVPDKHVNLLRVQNDTSIMKSIWHIRDRIRQCRDSVALNQLPQSVAKRKAPGHIRIPTVFRSR